MPITKSNPINYYVANNLSEINDVNVNKNIFNKIFSKKTTDDNLKNPKLSDLLLIFDNGTIMNEQDAFNHYLIQEINSNLSN